MKKITILLFIAALISVACHKDQDDGKNPSDTGIKKLPGQIYYKWADEGIFKLDFPSATRSLFLPDQIRRNGWDVSWDNQLVLECSDVLGDYEASQFTLSKISDGTIVKQFKYYATEGDIATGTLSPNGKFIAINPTFDDGIVILDLNGDEVQHIKTVNNEKISENPIWMPDNTLLIKHKQLLLNSSSDFKQVNLIKELDFQDWGSPSVSRDGKKIAFAASKHIWLMNTDGTDMKQITTSSAAETSPTFSPDGKYLLIGTDFHITGPFGSLFYLKVIPVDGRQYQVDDGAESKEVIPLLLPGKTILETSDGRVVWR